jgi:hypothetical protein
MRAGLAECMGSYILWFPILPVRMTDLLQTLLEFARDQKKSLKSNWYFYKGGLEDLWIKEYGEDVMKKIRASMEWDES